ncbi:hypothetical protein [Streptomyces sp. NPDC004285]
MTQLTSAAPGDGLRADAEEPVAWEVGRRFLLRAAGLPVETAHGLRCPRTRAWADTVLAHEERLADGGAALSEELHALVETADPVGDHAPRALLRTDQQPS